MKTLFVIAIIVIVVIILLWQGSDFSIREKCTDYLATPSSLYENVTGHISDKTSQLAITKAIKREHLNKTNERANRMSRKNIPKAAANAFILGNLIRFNGGNERREEVTDHYRTAMTRIRRNPDDYIDQEDNAEIIPVYNIIEHITDFANAYEDYAVRRMLQDELQDTRVHVLNARVNQVNRPIARQGIFGETMDPAPKLTKEKQDRYFRGTPVANDPQNVHEHQVNNDLQRIWTNIVKKNTDSGVLTSSPESVSRSITQIRRYIESATNLTPTQKQNASTTLSQMSLGNSISRLNTNEAVLLANVWNRINSPQNRDNRNNLRESLASGLADGIDRGHQVCVGGRVARVLGSLTRMDKDETISNPIVTRSILRNEVFSRSNDIIRKAVEKKKKENKVVANAYEGLVDDVDDATQAAVDAFEDQLRSELETKLLKEYEHTDGDVLREIIDEAKYGV